MKYRLLAMFFCGALFFGANNCANADSSTEQTKADIPYGIIEPARVASTYSGDETFHYEISYTGGLKLGEIEIELRVVDAPKEQFELYVLVTTEGSIFNTLYPVRDIHVTRVSGPERLPQSYEIWQKEGFSYQAHKVTHYDQVNGTVTYRRNESEPIIYEAKAPFHNEFSSFFASRLMSFEVGKSFLVPTFADKKRVDVEVKVIERVHFKKTALGGVDTFQISPILKFKGLYDKRGDTTIWYTDDVCRVPVKITSKLAIGSVTATLLSYENLACSGYSAEKPRQ